MKYRLSKDKSSGTRSMTRRARKTTDPEKRVGRDGRAGPPQQNAGHLNFAIWRGWCRWWARRAAAGVARAGVIRPGREGQLLKVEGARVTPRLCGPAGRPMLCDDHPRGNHHCGLPVGCGSADGSRDLLRCELGFAADHSDHAEQSIRCPRAPPVVLFGVVLDLPMFSAGRLGPRASGAP